AAICRDSRRTSSCCAWRALPVCCAAPLSWRKLLMSRCCPCSPLSASRLALSCWAMPELPCITLRIGRVARSTACSTTASFRSRAIGVDSPAGLFPPFHQLGQGQRIECRRPPVKHQGDVRHGVFYAVREASSLKRFCTKKPDRKSVV